MNHHLLLRGVRFSLLLHGIVLLLIVYVGNLLPEATSPLKMDFSIESDSTAFSSGDNSKKLPEPSRQRENPKLPIKKADPENKPRLVEKKPEAIKPEQAEPTRVKSEVKKPVPKKLVPLQTKKKIVVEEKELVTPVEQFTESTPVQIQPKEIEPAIVAPAEKVPSATREVPAFIPVNAPAIQAQSPSPKEHYVEANLSFIRDAVERETRYPDMARRMGWEGKVVIAFIVCPDGLVEDIRVIESCGFKALDKNAINTIKRCAPFPKPPIRAEVVLPITYRLN